METQVLNIGGMTCGMCVKHVTTALQDLPGVGNVSVSLEDNSATVNFEPAVVSIDRMVEAVANEGYSAAPL